MATARAHITKALQHLAVLPAGVSPSTTDDEPDCLVVLNNMLSNWSERRSRADLMARDVLAQVVSACAKGAQVALTGSGARTALENAAAAAAAGLAITAPSALTSYGTITTDNSYTAGFDEAIQYNLAVQLAGMYKRPVPPEVASAAKASYDAVMPPMGA
jgi:hypothetical protein